MSYMNDKRLPTERLTVVSYMIVGVIALLLFGFWKLQIIDSDRYSQMAERNRVRSIPIIAPRGSMLDREGRVLVDNYPSFSGLLLRDTPEQVEKLLPQIADGMGMTLDEVFASQSSIAAAVKLELDADMSTFGYEIVNVLVTDIVPDQKVKSAMNDINAAQREQVAANARGEAEKILVVKKAEAEAESKALQGQGIANQRKAIIEGLQVSVEQFQKAVEGATSKEVMQLVLVTQYFDTLKSIGESDKTNTLFLSHSPAAVNEVSDQILKSMLVANSAIR